MLGDDPPTIPADPIYAFLATEPPDFTSPPTPSTQLLTPSVITPNSTAPNSPEPELFQLSLQAVTGQPSPRTLRFVATIHGHPLTVLVDSGSSHNIIQPRIATFLHLPIQPLSSFTVMVGNGEHLHCTGLCIDTPLTVDEHTFNLSLYVLPIQGADVVLGVQWLQTLGPFVSGFTIPSMQFYHQDTLLTITGTKPNHVSPASFHQLTRMLHTHAIDSLHSISMVPSTHQISPSPTDDDYISATSTLNYKPLYNHSSTFSHHQRACPHTDPMITIFTLNLRLHPSTLNLTATHTTKKKP
jgi:hypothetical protein